MIETSRILGSSKTAEFIGVSYDTFMRTVKHTKLFKQTVPAVKTHEKAIPKYDIKDLEIYKQAIKVNH